MSAAPPAPTLRRRLRTACQGLATVLGLARRGFFIPYRHAAAVADASGADAYAALTPLFAAQRDAFAAHIDAIDGFAAELAAIGDAPAPAPRWNQHWFAPLDAAAAYAMVRLRRPTRLIEVGSGHSTRFLARAAADGEIGTRITAIDPAPRAPLPPGVEHRAAPLQRAALDIAAELAPGDMLFVDSSHVLVPGSDVDALLTAVWPKLEHGVIVHFHDIFLPDGYPAAWRWRGYNEQSGVAALLAGGGAGILFASHYAATRMADRIEASTVARLPRKAGAIDSSLWLAKRGTA